MILGNVGTRHHLFFSLAPISKKQSAQAKALFDSIKKKLPPLSQIDSLLIDSNRVVCYQNNGEKKSIYLDSSLQRALKQFQRVSWLCDRLYISKVMRSEKKNTLYLYSSGGGGHRSAKEALIEKECSVILKLLKSSGDLDGEQFCSLTHFVAWCRKNHLIDESDVLVDFLGDIGRWAAEEWNQAQKDGDVEELERLASMQWMTDILFSAPIYFATLKKLRDLNPDQVICTQAMALPSLLGAISTYNMLYRHSGDRDIKLKLYMTDMPTKHATHYFDALKRIPKIGSGKCYLELYVPKSNRTIDWQQLGGIDDEQIFSLEAEELPVRYDFITAASQFQLRDPPAVELTISCQAEWAFLKETLEKQGGDLPQTKLSGNGSEYLLNYLIQYSHQNFFIMLGSQPTKTAVKSYIDTFIALAKKQPTVHYCLFAFTGAFDRDDPHSFYREICYYLQRRPNWPKNLRALPLSLQHPRQLVSLELQCHTITRSGGATAMELLVIESARKSLRLAARHRYLHVQKVAGRSALDESIPLWERGNYLFLKNQLNAELITPDLLPQHPTFLKALVNYL